VPLTFEWDSRKASSNLSKHGVRFETAATVFGDPSSLTIPDPDHSVMERRFVTMGRSFDGKLLVSFTPTEAIISASSVQEARVDESENCLKKKSNNGMRAEYNFSRGERGKHARRYAEGANVVVLDPDVAKAFPNSKKVNASLRKLIRAEASA
jgi:uncharacterized protein